MIKLFEFTFLDIYNKEYTINIYDSEGTTQGNVLTAKLYGQDGFILNYEKENIDIVQGGIIKSDVTFSVVNEGGILDNFLKNLQSYENRYLVEIMYNENIFWRGIMLNDYITFDDSKLQVIKFSCTDGLGILQNIDYTDDISKLDSTTMQYDSDAYGNGLIDVISRALSFNPTTKFFEGGYNYIYYTADYISEDMLNDWDALVYTNILKHKADTTLLTTPFADYTIKQTLAGNRIKVYEYKSCYDVINECLKVFNLCLCQRNGVWQIFNIRDFENNKDSYGYYVAGYNDYNYYKNSKYNTSRGSFGNAKYAIGGTNTNKRGSGEFGLNTVVKKIEQRYVPYYVKEGKFNNLLYSGNHGGDLQWYSYPAGVITGVSNGNLVYESNFNDWNLCSKYHYHNELDIFAAMTKLQFLINFAIKYTLSAGSGYVHTSMIKPKMDLNLKINGKWLDNNGNWVDNLPIGNWWHKFTGVFEGYDRVINVNFSKYFDLLIPNQSSGKLVVDFYFRIYTQTNVIGTLPWNFKITNIDNNSVLKLVDNNGNDIESIDYIVENDSGILDLELEQAFIDNFSESEENNVLFTATEDLGLNSYRYKKSKKWRHSDETNYYNLVELRLREIAAMNNHPLLSWQGTIYYDKDTNVNYMLFYLIKYNLTLQNYVMFPQRWTFYARKRYAETDLIEVSKDFVRVVSSNDLAIADFNLPMVPVNSGTGTIVAADEGVAIVSANRINLSANTAVNEIINVSRQNGSTDFVVEYDEDNQEINWKNDTDTLLKITNDGISYKNEKTAGNGIEIDSNNKINVKIDNDTIKIDSNNKLYANINEIVRYMQDSIAKYDKYDFAIVECFLAAYTQIAFPDYTNFDGLRAWPVVEIKNRCFQNIKFTGDFKMNNLEIVNTNEFYESLFDGIFEGIKIKNIGQNAFPNSNFTGSLNLPVCESIGLLAFDNSHFIGSLNLPICTNIGYGALPSSNFTGSLSLPACERIGDYAFHNSNFSGELNLPVCTYIGTSAFKNSNFSGSLNLPVCTEIRNYAFQNSNFTTITIGANATLEVNCIGAHSAEFINDYTANGKLAGTYVWDADTNHWVYQSALHDVVENYANTIKTWAGIDLWLRADWGVVTDSNNKVSRWEDFVHPDYNIIQNTADYRPLLVDNYANTFPALQFDGVDDYLNGGDICDLKLTGGTLIAVLQHEYLTNNYHFAISKADDYKTDKSWYIRIISGSGGYSIAFAVVKGSEITYSLGGRYQTPDYKLENVVTAWKIDNANNVIKKYQNGVNTDTDAFDGTYDMNNNYDLIIGGCGRIGLPPILFWEGHIMEIIKFDRVLSDSEFAYVHEYLNLKYNLY